MADYDVFLNHYGRDVKSGFVAHLDDALRRSGLNPFLDKKSLVKGSPAFTSIDNALEVAKVHVAVVSKGYAKSKYCLNELVAMMRSGKPVIPIFYDVEPTHLRWVEKGPFALAFQKHKSRESLEVVVDWENALRKLAEVTGFCFCLSDYNGDEAELKWKVVDAIMNLICTNEALEVNQYIVGCTEPMKRCIQEVEKMQGTTNLLGLVGMGGIGKTTLAKVIYNHLIGHKKFQFSSFIEIDSGSSLNLEIGSNFVVNRLRKQLLEDLLHVPHKVIVSAQSYNYWFCKLSCLGPVLIVLDNISKTHQFEELIINTRLLAHGSCIIVTSRDRHLLKVVARETHFYLHEVTTLGCDDSQKLFNWHAFHQEEVLENFEALSNAVIKGCGGLPLALKVVGSNLFGMTTNEDRRCIWPQAVNALKGEPDVMNALRWSYNRLSESEKLMFVDIACVFCGWKEYKAMQIWNSSVNCLCCGFGTPDISLRHLVNKSLVVLEKSGNMLAMHSILRDLGQDIGRINGSHLWEGGISNAIMAKEEGTSKVRALNLANNSKDKFGGQNFAEMRNLHFLKLDGCKVSGDLRSSSKQLRWLQWRNMPSAQVSVKLDLSNLVSLDFSYSTKLANLWTKSNPWLKACPNLLRLKLKGCTSIKELPDSIKLLSQLRTLTLDYCSNLQRLPTCIGELSSLESLFLKGCGSLKALPYSITKLPKLKNLFLNWCASLKPLHDNIGSLPKLHILNIPGCLSASKLPGTLGYMTSLQILSIDLMIGQQTIDTTQLYGLLMLQISNCTDEGITLIDSLSTFKNLYQLWLLSVRDSLSMTKLPETITVLTNLRYLELCGCEKFHVFPNSFGQLKMLSSLVLIDCNNLKVLPYCSEVWRNLKVLIIERCKSISKLPNFITEVNELEFLYVHDCGSLKDLNALSTLQSLCIWGCTSIKELQGSHLVVADIHFRAYRDAFTIDYYVLDFEYRLKESRVLEENDCGSLRIHNDRYGDPLLLRIHKSPCKKKKMKWKVE